MKLTLQTAKWLDFKIVVDINDGDYFEFVLMCATVLPWASRTSFNFALKINQKKKHESGRYKKMKAKIKNIILKLQSYNARQSR